MATLPAVSNMATDLRDGLRLCKLAERLTSRWRWSWGRHAPHIQTSMAEIDSAASGFTCLQTQAYRPIRRASPFSNALQASTASLMAHASRPTAGPCAWPTCSWRWMRLRGQGCRCRYVFGLDALVPAPALVSAVAAQFVVLR